MPQSLIGPRANPEVSVRVIRADGRSIIYGKPGTFRFWYRANVVPFLKNLFRR
jgi:hypothetical protein